MLKRELKFSTYLLPLMMVSFLPLLSYADTNTPPAPAITKDQLQLLTALAGQSITVAGKTFKLQEMPQSAPPAAPANPQQSAAAAAPSPSAPVQAPAPAPAQETSGFLNAEDLSAVGVNMTIKVTGQQASLDGYVPRDCAQHIDIRVTGPSSGLLFAQNDKTKYEGFAAYGDGQFLSCMHEPKNNCISNFKECTSLSSRIEAPGHYAIDRSEDITIAYLNAKSGTPQPSSTVKVIGQANWLSATEQAALDANARRQRDVANDKAREAAAKANVTNLSNCVKVATTDADFAKIEEMATPAYLNDGDITKINSLVEKRKDALEKAKTDGLIKNIAALLKTSKTGTGLVVKGKKKKKDDDDDDVSTDEIADRIGKLEDKVYEYAGQLDTLKDEDKIEEKEYQKQEDILATAVQNLIKLRLKDDQSPESFDAAREMLARALGDSDDEDGNELHPSAKVVKILEATDKVLVVSKVASEGKTCMEEQARLASYDKSDCEDANADYKKLHDKLQKKETACAKMKKMDKDEKAECKANSNELKLLGDDIAQEANEVNTEYQTAVANLQKSRGIAGNGQVQQPNALAQQAGLANGQFPGSPAAYNPNSTGVPVFGAANGLGVYPQAVPYQQAAMSYPQIGISPYQQTGVYPYQSGVYNGVYGGYLH